jgi:DNA repair ATPase RecN
MLTRKSHVLVMAAALGAILSAPLTVADTVRSQPSAPAQEQIAGQLDGFKYTAASLLNETDQYASSVRSNDLHYQSHAYNLNSAREKVNDLGAKLSELERLSPQGTELQRAAIREAKSHLEALADHLQSIIAMLNDDQRSHRFPDFRDKVKSLYEHADNLYTKVDAITDYEKARDHALGAGVFAGSNDV